jgi:hypothetical protein
MSALPRKRTIPRPHPTFGFCHLKGDCRARKGGGRGFAGPMGFGARQNPAPKWDRVFLMLAALGGEPLDCRLADDPPKLGSPRIKNLALLRYPDARGEVVDLAGD